MTTAGLVPCVSELRFRKSDMADFWKSSAFTIEPPVVEQLPAVLAFEPLTLPKMQDGFEPAGRTRRRHVEWLRSWLPVCPQGFASPVDLHHVPRQRETDQTPSGRRCHAPARSSVEASATNPEATSRAKSSSSRNCCCNVATTDSKSVMRSPVRDSSQTRLPALTHRRPRTSRRTV